MLPAYIFVRAAAAQSAHQLQWHNQDMGNLRNIRSMRPSHHNMILPNIVSRVKLNHHTPNIRSLHSLRSTRSRNRAMVNHSTNRVNRAISNNP